MSHINDPTSTVHNYAQPIIAMTAKEMAGHREKCLSVEMRLKSDTGAAAAIDGSELADTPILDTTVALALMDGDIDTLLIILALVRDQLPEDLRAIASALNANDAPSVKKTSHRLKGVVGQIGAARAHAACRRLEAAAANGDVSGADELHQNLVSELDALSAAITGHLSVAPAAST